MDTMDMDMTLQDKWERIKRVTRKIIQKFGVKHVSWRRMSIKHLERKRNRLLRSKPPKATFCILLPKIDSMLQTLQQELVETAALKAGDTWNEKEKNPPATWSDYTKLEHLNNTWRHYRHPTDIAI